MMRVIAEPAFNAEDDNPYTWLLYSHMRALGIEVDGFSGQRLLKNHYTIWHRHWPERNLNEKNRIKAIAKTQALVWLMKMARRRGTKIVWTVHNLAAHERRYPQQEAAFWEEFIHQLDGYISFSEAGLDATQHRFPALKNCPGFVIPHGHYRGEYPNSMTSKDARTVLGIPATAKVLLFFGKLRPYKNVPQLIRIFQQYSDPEAILYIVGAPDFPESATELERQAASDPRVRLYLDFIPKDKAQIYFGAADLVVLPYREILNSGSALLALSFNRPVCVPRRGSLGELQDQIGSEWVFTYTGEINTLQLEEAVNWALTTPRPEEAPLLLFNWQTLAQQTLEAYQVIVSG